MVQIKTDPGLTAILGPTNTGKTFYAIERMLGYRSGVIGFPLRLLARENYDKVCSRVGSRNVALLTGEEKITPKTARYLICTVESMPLDWPADFIAIDEIQFCADPERGYIYSNRLFRARGLRETMFLGAETIRPVLEKLIPEIKIETRSRFSKLSWAGVKKLSRIPKRSAVVAFSTNDVYAIAEGIRRGRGGAAVVLGALSPRARNAQVAMYEAGEVDYLVATDAIGMGLNMDIEHVLFSSLKKFDGSKFRTLDMQEIAQIAGRAGRHTRDGTFGSLPEVGEFEPDLISAIETHNFPSIRQIWWRNANLEFRSLRDLLVSLEDVPQSGILIKKRNAEDHRALRKMANLNDITRLASGRQRLRLLWEVCQIPDFRKTLADAHINLLKRIYLYLCGPSGSLPIDWVCRQLEQVDRVDGDIDTLMARIAHSRTWTYILHRSGWIQDPENWRERSRTIEDRLSDALHARLRERFVDRKGAFLVQIKNKTKLPVTVGEDGVVSAAGEILGYLHGLKFKPDKTNKAEFRNLAVSAARRGLSSEINCRVNRILDVGENDLTLTSNGSVCWLGASVAVLTSGADILSPNLRLEADDLITVQQRESLEAKLKFWLKTHIGSVLKMLIALRDAELAGASRGIAFQLSEALGALPRSQISRQLKILTAIDKKKLRALGLRIGLKHVYLPALQKAQPLEVKSALWAAWQQRRDVAPPVPGKVAAQTQPGVPIDYYKKLGFFPAGNRVVRVDVLDKLSIRLLGLSKQGTFKLPAGFSSTLGLSNAEMTKVIKDLGYRLNSQKTGFDVSPTKTRKQRRSNATSRRTVDTSSPFSVLSQFRA